MRARAHTVERLFHNADVRCFFQVDVSVVSSPLKANTFPPVSSTSHGIFSQNEVYFNLAENVSFFTGWYIVISTFLHDIRSRAIPLTEHSAKASAVDYLRNLKKSPDFNYLKKEFIEKFTRCFASSMICAFDCAQ